MSKLSTIARTAALMAVCACASSGASRTPSAATLALYDVNAYRPSSGEAAATPVSRPSDGSSSALTAMGDFVRSRNPQLQFCYEETRAKHPQLAGSATIGVLLAPDGSVTRADVLRRSWQGGGADEVEACVLAKVKTWKFPTDGSTARPYSFSAVFTR